MLRRCIHHISIVPSYYLPSVLFLLIIYLQSQFFFNVYTVVDYFFVCFVYVSSR